MAVIADESTRELRRRLYRELRLRQDFISRRRDYYDGNHPLATAPNNKSEEFQRLAVLGQANLTANIVDTVVDRLQMVNMRGSDEVWRALQGNHMIAEADCLHEEALKVGRSFVWVWPNEDSPVGVDVTPEDPTEVIVRYEAGRRHMPTAGFKVYRDGDHEYSALVMPEFVEFRQRQVAEQTHVPTNMPDRTGDTVSTDLDALGEWQEWGGPYDDGDGPNPFNAVPIVEFQSRCKLYGPVQPELTESVLRTQDRINKTMFDLVVTAEYQAFPQRVTIGIEQQKDQNGNAVNPLQSGPNRVWELLADDPSKAQVFQLTAADLSNLIRFVEADLRLLSAQSRTPMFALAGDLVNIGADTVDALDAALKAKAQRHARNLDSRWHRVGELVDRAINGQTVDAPGQPAQIEVVWGDFELFTFTQRADAAIKLRTAGYPFVAIARKMGETPDEIARLLDERQAEIAAGTSPDVDPIGRSASTTQGRIDQPRAALITPSR